MEWCWISVHQIAKDGIGRKGNGGDGTGKEVKGEDGRGKQWRGLNWNGRESMVMDGKGQVLGLCPPCKRTGLVWMGAEWSGRDGTEQDGRGLAGSGLERRGGEWNGLQRTGIYKEVQMKALELFQNGDNVTRPRINLEKLQPGTFIPFEAIEEAAKISRDEKRFAFVVMAIQQDIMNGSMAQGCCLIAKTESGKGLRILENAEASEYCPDQCDQKLVGHARWVDRAKSAVNITELSEEQQKRFTNRMSFHARVRQQIETEQRQRLKEEKPDEES
jgi:hypothetical protein